ncbi:serine/threonine protein kinase [Thiocapsa roseopersicina]|uniref:non-specific serine/threonine protein kinase n=1 Tax=Thiocapsa roseopersicina TaxID=1058 RepID=A0A1H2UJ52_THIRO|nr:serine/threonine-protein kinase [Thiocapsa roseopersicina]SDW56186.1 Protein kinase domain-containing protein [Thiocapsa roseopersicina]
MAVARDSLPAGTLLGPYRVVKTIAQGGFSLIYLAYDEDSGEEVVIKEYMPKKIARRDRARRVMASEPQLAENLHQGRKLFFQEAKALAALKHPSIVRVLDFFLANDTGYLVMPNERGRNLGAYVAERRGGLSTTFILDVFIPVLDALSLLHRRSMVHLDVKPGNIHLRHGNRPMLLDLGAVHPLAKGRARGGQVITAGYSPIEQYLRDGHIGPWTDVYAVGASIRACMEGRTPPPAPERQKEDTLIPATVELKTRYPFPLLRLVDWSMSLEVGDRPQDAGELLAAVLEEVARSPDRVAGIPSSASE